MVVTDRDEALAMINSEIKRLRLAQQANALGAAMPDAEFIVQGFGKCFEDIINDMTKSDFARRQRQGLPETWKDRSFKFDPSTGSFFEELAGKTQEWARVTIADSPSPRVAVTVYRTTSGKINATMSAPVKDVRFSYLYLSVLVESNGGAPVVNRTASSFFSYVHRSLVEIWNLEDAYYPYITRLDGTREYLNIPDSKLMDYVP